MIIFPIDIALTPALSRLEIREIGSIDGLAGDEEVINQGGMSGCRLRRDRAERKRPIPPLTPHFPAEDGFGKRAPIHRTDV